MHRFTVPHNFRPHASEPCQNSLNCRSKKSIADAAADGLTTQQNADPQQSQQLHYYADGPPVNADMLLKNAAETWKDKTAENLEEIEQQENYPQNDLAYPEEEEEEDMEKVDEEEEEEMDEEEMDEEADYGREGGEERGWQAGPWSSCSAACGGGVRVRYQRHSF